MSYLTCSLEDSLFECQDCDWISDSEIQAEIHRRRHRVRVRYLNLLPVEELVALGRTIIGRCYRCGYPFSDRAHWAHHELSIESRAFSHSDQVSGRGRHANLDEIERRRTEPMYVYRHLNSPGSPKCTKQEADAYRWDTRSRRQ